MPNERRSPSERYEWYQAIYETPIYTPPASVTWTTEPPSTATVAPPPQNDRIFNIDYAELERYWNTVYDGNSKWGKSKERRTKLGNILD